MADGTTKVLAVASKGKWSNLKKYACRICFFLVILQVPLFRVPCRSGMCSTPLQVTSSQLIASEIFPVPVVKGLLYPGAVVNGLISNMTIPSWENLLSVYNLTGIKEASAVTDLQRLESNVSVLVAAAKLLLSEFKDDFLKENSVEAGLVEVAVEAGVVRTTTFSYRLRPNWTVDHLTKLLSIAIGKQFATLQPPLEKLPYDLYS